MAEHTHNPACAESPEDLVALVWGQLSETQRARLERHLESCAACREDYEQIRSVQASVRLVGAITPSPGFRSRLMTRIRQMTPSRGLEAAGPASRRLAKIVERDRPIVSWIRPRFRIIAFAASVAAAAAFLLVSPLILVKEPATQRMARPPLPPPQEGQATVARWKERRECMQRRGHIEARLDGSSLDVSRAVDDGAFIMTGSADVTQHERCVLLFRAADWEEYCARFTGAPPSPEKRRFDAMAGARRAVSVTDGRLGVPASFVSTYLDNASDVVILRLHNRTEIWSCEHLRTHIRSIPPPTIDIQETSGISAVCFGRGRESV